jgi:hypothetical protein
MLFYVSVVFTGSFVTREKQKQVMPELLREFVERLKFRINQIQEKREKDEIKKLIKEKKDN